MGVLSQSKGAQYVRCGINSGISLLSVVIIYILCPNRHNSHCLLDKMLKKDKNKGVGICQNDVLGINSHLNLNKTFLSLVAFCFVFSIIQQTL